MNIIIDKIRKYYHSENNALEIILTNYNGINYYIRLDIDEKHGICYLRSYNLNINTTFNKKNINQEILNIGLINFLNDILSRYQLLSKYDLVTSDYNKISVRIRYNKTEEFIYNFNQFIPDELLYVAEIFYALMENLPKRMTPLFEEMFGHINHQEMKYLYNKAIKFNFKKDKIESLFEKDVIKKGNKYYKENRVRFLEKIADSYYAIVEGNNHNLYSVIIDIDNKKHLIRTSCTCPCEFRCKHMYAVLKHIINKESFKFYKVRYVEDKSINMFDKIFSNNYYLCIGISGNNLILILPSGEITEASIYDRDNNKLFEVLEDDEENTLTNHINEIKKS